MHWRYCSFALSHQCYDWACYDETGSLWVAWLASVTEAGTCHEIMDVMSCMYGKSWESINMKDDKIEVIEVIPWKIIVQAWCSKTCIGVVLERNDIRNSVLNDLACLTHQSLLLHIHISELGIIGLGNGLFGTKGLPKQWSCIDDINWTPQGKKLQCNCN